MIYQQFAFNVRVFDRHLANFKDYIAVRVVCLRENISDLAPDHAGDDARDIQLARGLCADRAPVSEHRDAIRDAEHFVQLV